MWFIVIGISLIATLLVICASALIEANEKLKVICENLNEMRAMEIQKKWSKK
jgi:hypothetical protein